MRLADATWTDVDRETRDIALLPVGSTEQHGPHAPLGTDHLTAAAIANSAAEAADDPIAVAPPVPVGISEEHRQFTGTLWVAPDTFRAYVRETIESLLDHGWDRVIIVNGHGGNIAALEEVAAGLTRDREALVVPFTWFDEVDVDLDMGHGGPLETSLLLARYPELVREDRLEEAAEGGADRWGDWVGKTNLAPDSAQFTENGTVGDPGAASAEVGRKIERQATDALQTLMAELGERSLSTPPHR